MAKQWQIRRGTTAENDDFTGAIGELTMDTDTKGMRIHDGSTQGGIDVPTAGTADYVVEWQNPTAANNYTWYRKYKSGWVEQGAFRDNISDTSITITLPVEMANAKYAPEIKRITTEMSGSQPNVNFVAANTITTTGFKIADQWGGSGVTVAWGWEVKGMAA